MKFEVFNSMQPAGMIKKNNIVNFLHKHLEQYRDTKPDIQKALDYALQETSVDGGFIVVGSDEKTNETIGIVVINRTGMEGYIPENILVYIAVNKEYRGKGYGKELMDKALSIANGSVALHVEHDNPARFLYEKVGFTNKYLEYRLSR